MDSSAKGAIKLLGGIQGFPIAMRNYENGQLQEESILESVQDIELDASTFDPPKGYRKQSIMPR